MLLFNNAEYDSFFNPLCCKNKRIYYECILQLIEKSKSVPLLYETDAKDTIILYLRNCAYAVEDEVASSNADENISSKKTETENAGAILRYFRRCGWISEREIGRNGDNIATVMPYCRKMIEAIERIFNRDNRAALTNHIFSIYDTLNTAFVADHGRTHRPYSTILIPVSDNVADLKNELLILKDSIRSIMRMIIKMTETNELGQFLIRDEMLENFFSDYFFIKKDGLIPGYIEEIEKMLRKIVKTEVYENMIKEYQSFYNADEISAREVVDGQLAEIKSFISYDYIKEMDYIDKKINNYYSLSGTRDIPMTEEVRECLERIVANRKYPKVEPIIDGYTGFLFYDKNNNPMVALNWEKYFHYAVGRYNRTYRVQIPKITPHVCRHTYCSNMARAGMNPKTLQYLMGHSDIGVTLNTYTHLGAKDAREELERLNLAGTSKGKMPRKVVNMP